MKCKNCGVENKNDAVYCKCCGKKIVLGNQIENKNQSDNIDNGGNLKKKKTKSIVGFICSLCGILTCGISSIIGLIFSILGLSESKKRGETDGFAIAGIICSSAYILIILFVVLIALMAPSETENKNIQNEAVKNNTTSDNKEYISVIDFSEMSIDDANKWCTDNNILCITDEEYSNEVEKGKFIRQSIAPGKEITSYGSIRITYSLGKKPTVGEKNALSKAKDYSKIMHMSKAGIYDQLISEYGEGFTESEAQYAIDNIVVDWKENALIKAKEYQSTMHMSKSRIYEQLTSEYGEKFTADEAQYAIDHLED